jgi:uncharacterized protein
MAFRSAAVINREFNFSEYVPALGIATFAVVGGASKGPLNTPTKATTEAELVGTFGKPLLTDYALLSAIRFLRKGNSLIFTRIANGAVSADIPIPGLNGGTPAVRAQGTVAFTSGLNPADGDFVTLHKTVPYARVERDSVGAAGNVAITKTGANIIVTGMVGGSPSAVATGTIAFLNGAQPADGNNIVISDGTTAVTFEFDSNSSVVETSTLRQVVIGADAYATMTALITKINAAAFNCTATDLDIAKTFEFDNNASWVVGRVGVGIGASAAATLLNLISAIASQVATLGMSVVNTTVTVPTLTVTQAAGGTAGNGPIIKSGTNVAVTGCSGGADAVAGVSSTVLGIIAKTPGTHANGTQVEVRATTTVGAPAGNFDLLVYATIDESDTLQIVERWNNLNLDSNGDRYIETILSTGDNGSVPSSYITADVLEVLGTPTVGTYTLGQAPGNAGVDGTAGLTTADYIGTVSGQIATGLKALANPERVQFNILAIPGQSHRDIINAAISLVETRGDAVYLVDVPFGLTRDQAINWHNGVDLITPNAPIAAINSSYAVIYWSWIKDRDAYSGREVWLPPSGFVAGAYAYTDKVAGPWFAPAGHNRGPIDGVALEYSPDQAERDMLNANSNRINPIVRFSDGIKLFGNRTSHRVNSALDSIHTRRMLIYAETVIASSVKFLLFDPNDPITWRRFEMLVNPVLEQIKTGRGLEEFFVRCDKTTNPADQRQQGVMRGKIGIRPVGTAEIIYNDFALFATGAEFTDNF